MDVATLQAAAGISLAMATKWADPVSAATALYAIDTSAKLAAFIAQVGHESEGFVYTQEIWGPTAAQIGYEGRADLGNTQPGDGRLFCGRGLIEITGRANYAAYSADSGFDYIANPSQLSNISDSALSAAWFWNVHNLNQFCTGSPDDFITLTKRINGGTNGLADRQARWDVAKKVLGA